MNIEISGANEAARATAKLGRDLEHLAQRAIAEGMDWIADQGRAELAAHSRIGELVAPTIRSTDTTVVAGGSAAVSRSASANDLIRGAEFGGGGRARTTQFGRYSPRGFGLWPAISKGFRRIHEATEREVSSALDDWGRGG